MCCIEVVCCQICGDFSRKAMFPMSSYLFVLLLLFQIHNTTSFSYLFWLKLELKFNFKNIFLVLFVSHTKFKVQNIQCYSECNKTVLLYTLYNTTLLNTSSWTLDVVIWKLPRTDFKDGVMWYMIISFSCDWSRLAVWMSGDWWLQYHRRSL